jgi:hypothetical protein
MFTITDNALFLFFVLKFEVLTAVGCDAVDFGMYVPVILCLLRTAEQNLI